MKKLLSILAAISFTTSSSVLVVSCNPTRAKNKKINIQSSEIKDKVLAENIQNLNNLDAVNAKLK